MSSLLALPCPLSGPPTPPGGADTHPCSTSRGAAIVAALVKPKAKTPHATAGRCCSCVDYLPVIPAPDTPRPLLVLLGVESPGDPACTGRLPTVVWRRFSGGWLWPPCLPPPPAWGRLLAALLWCPPPPPPPPPPLGAGVLRPLCGGRLFSWVAHRCHGVHLHTRSLRNVVVYSRSMVP